MKYALILAICVSSYSFAATPKPKAPTEAEKCWLFVQQTAKTDMEKEAAKDFDSVLTLDGRLHGCTEILKGYQSAFAQQLANLLIANRHEKQYLEQVKLLRAENEKKLLESLAAKEESDKRGELVKALVAAYSELQTTYTSHLQADAALTSQMAPYVQPQQRGVWASFAQGVGDAAKAQASRPRIQCTSTTFGNTTDTDCH